MASPAETLLDGVRLDIFNFLPNCFQQMAGDRSAARFGVHNQSP